MKTTIYIDGFNFYYGCLKGTRYKWLDIPLFFEKTLRNIHNDFDIQTINYFTSDILSKFAKYNNSEQAQQHYLNALSYLYPDKLNIIKGRYDARRFEAICYQSPLDLDSKVLTWKLEEKQTDVSIAVAMLEDVFFEQTEQIIVCSSDSDLIPALELIKRRFPQISVGIIVPANIKQRNVNYPCDWYTRVQSSLLAKYQLPNVIQKSNRKQIKKPKHW